MHHLLPMDLRVALALCILFPAIGCRAPAIPPQPSAREYAVYAAWITQASSSLPQDLDFAVDALTLTPQQAELQFQQCLPRRMEDIFNGAPEVTLHSASTSGDWLNLGDGRHSHLHPHAAPVNFSRPTELFRVSRVAFTRTGYQAFFWVEHWTCRATAPGTDARIPEVCGNGGGALLHGIRSGGAWRFEDTLCQAITFPT